MAQGPEKTYCIRQVKKNLLINEKTEDLDRISHPDLSKRDISKTLKVSDKTIKNNNKKKTKWQNKNQHLIKSS